MHPKISHRCRMLGRKIFRPVFHSQIIRHSHSRCIRANNYLPLQPLPNFLSFPNVRAKYFSPYYHNPVSSVGAKYLLPCIPSQIIRNIHSRFIRANNYLPLQLPPNFLSFPNVRAKYFSPCI